jgi:hypothetical protein
MNVDRSLQENVLEEVKKITERQRSHDAGKILRGESITDYCVSPQKGGGGKGESRGDNNVTI